MALQRGRDCEDTIVFFRRNCFFRKAFSSKFSLSFTLTLYSLEQKRVLPNGRWEVHVKLSTDGNKQRWLGIVLRASPQDDDYLRGTSVLAWIRGKATISLCKVNPPKVIKLQNHRSLDLYTSVTPESGDDEFILLEEVTRCLDRSGSLAVQLKFTTAEPKILHTYDSETALQYFDQPGLADVAFCFLSKSLDSSPRYIFASKQFLIEKSSYFHTLFSSGFAETAPTTSTNAIEFSTTAIFDKSFTFDESELYPFYTSSNATQDESSTASASSQSNKLRDVEDQDLSIANLSLSSKQPSTVKPKESSKRMSKNCLPVITVTQIDYTTYRAMLAYLYTSTVSFTQLPPEYLIKAQEVLWFDDSLDDSLVFLFPSPQEWLLDNFKALQGQRECIQINPCCPRTMYRLADCYEIEELRELARNRILESLTIENAAYELFSPLSFDYDEIQEAVLEFFKKN
ncbi:hypothetical protein JCM5353_000204 [Sporobolomyces roseus]